MVAIVSRICGRFSFSQAKMEDSEEFRSVMAQIVQRVNEKSEVIQTVVLVPTRETALQVMLRQLMRLS